MFLNNLVYLLSYSEEQNYVVKALELNNNTSAFAVNLPWLPFEKSSKCFGEIGCLNITRDWYHFIYRPFNVFPLSRDVINTRFILYTQHNPKEGQIINYQKHSILASNICFKCLSKFIIHGFIDTPLSNWISEMKDEILKSRNINVIVVDWAGGSLPLYTQATANTRVVGLEIAFFINTLIVDHSFKANDIHLIGHSLGAHTAGYAGEMISNLGRITGLDPAEPYFQGMGPSIRLDPTDALYVDVIHTDGRNFLNLEIPGYGMSQSCGHIDFYPNNGKEQPGCAITQENGLIPFTLIKDGIEEASRVLLACNHVRAIKLFTDSINGLCKYIAHRCPSFDQFMSGRCFKCNSQNCALMGYHSVKPVFNNSYWNMSPNNYIHNWNNLTDFYGGKYYLATGRNYPYCHHHYRFIIELHNPQNYMKLVIGYLSLNIHTNNGIVMNIDLTPKKPVQLEHGSTYQIVNTNPHELGEHVYQIELNWTHEINVLEPRSLCIFWCNDHLYVRSITMETLHLEYNIMKSNNKYSTTLCASEGLYADIENRGKYTFSRLCSATT